MNMYDSIEKKRSLYKTHEVSVFTGSDSLLCDECDVKVVKEDDELVCPDCGLIAGDVYQKNATVEIEIPLPHNTWVERKLAETRKPDHRKGLGTIF